MNYELKIHEQLLQFTLFQGMSPAELMEVVGHTKLGFSKIQTDRWLVKEGEPCKQLHLLTSGSLTVETISDDRKCRVVETVKAPYIVQPERLFGLTQLYGSSFKTQTACNFITLDKQEVLLLLDTQLVFRLNMLNMLAAEVQRLRHNAWRSAPQSLRTMLVRYFFSHCIHPAGPKTFYVLMNQLAAELNDSRLDVSRTLNEMQSDGMLTLYRGRIEIPMLERLLM